MVSYIEIQSRVERPHSNAALWCQRLAVFCLPYLMIVIVGHRAGVVDTVSTFWLIGLLVLMLAASLAAGAIGFYQLWNYGYKAGMRATRGMSLSLILMLPFAYYAVLGFSLPKIYDISTDLDDPPAYDALFKQRSDAMNSLDNPGQLQMQMQLQAYPRVVARRYPLDAGKVFREVIALIRDRGWAVITEDTVPGRAAIDQEESGLTARPVVDADGLPLRIALPSFRPRQSSASQSDDSGGREEPFETIQISPIGRTVDDSVDIQEERHVEAVAKSFLFGFESDVVVRMIEAEEGTLVDMRATSRWAAHDMGSNAEIIISFLNDLDVALQGLSR